MATSLILLINNERVIVDNELVIYTGTSRSSAKLLTRKSKRDVTEEVMAHIEDLMEAEREDYFHKFVIKDEPYFAPSNSEMRIKSVETPLYEIFCKLSESKQTALSLSDPVTGVPENITARWNRRRIQFFLDEVVKYSDLIPMLERLVNPSIKYNKLNNGLVFKSGQNTMMHLVHIDVPGIRNPFTWFKEDLKKTKMFRMAFDENYERIVESFEDPQLFHAITNRETAVVNVATALDVLKLCNIDFDSPTVFNSTALVRLVGGLAANRYGASNENILIPTNGTIHVVFRENAEGFQELINYSKDRDSLDVGEGDTVAEWSLMYFFLRMILGTDDAARYLADFEGARLIS